MKRPQGLRPKVILDEYYIQVLKALCQQDYTQTELAEKVGVNYQHIISKIQPLIDDKVILLDRSSAKGRTVIIQLNPKYKEAVQSIDSKLTTKKYLDFQVFMIAQLKEYKDVLGRMGKNLDFISKKIPKTPKNVS